MRRAWMPTLGCCGDFRRDDSPRKKFATRFCCLPGSSTSAEADRVSDLYEYSRDNVATYTPLESFGPETYRRSVYHQNARASFIDVLTDFDAPDCAFSVSRRIATTTPAQALALMNHSFTMDMAESLAVRLARETSPDDVSKQVEPRICC